MTKNKRKEYQKKIEEKRIQLLEEYEEEYKNTSWYLNTANCILDGAINELKTFNSDEVDYDGIGCYIGGRIRALEKLKKMVIYDDEI